MWSAFLKTIKAADKRAGERMRGRAAARAKFALHQCDTDQRANAYFFSGGSTTRAALNRAIHANAKHASGEHAMFERERVKMGESHKCERF